MEKEYELECEYCGVSITEENVKCPNCGANCTKTIRKYKELQKKKAEEEFQKKLERSTKTSKDIQNAIMVPFIYFFVAFVMIVVVVMLFISSYRAHQNFEQNQGILDQQHETAEVEYPEVAEFGDYSFVLDEYELYEYKSDSFPNQYNTPEGYQKIAFHFKYTNSSKNAYNLSYKMVSLKADGYKVDSSNLEVGVFEKVVKGKEKYPAFEGTMIKEGETFQGYLGWLVPKNRKILRFEFKDVTIVMANPVYEE